ncbi:hypothetical protein ACFLYF_01365 [Chloroflexota bacterium]
MRFLEVTDPIIVYLGAGTDAEVCAYLYTAGLSAPMDHDWSQIYLYVAIQ